VLARRLAAAACAVALVAIPGVAQAAPGLAGASAVPHRFVAPRLSIADENSYRGEVKTWQTRLAALGYPIVADGYYGPRSRKVDKTFQKTDHLPVTGVVTAKVWNASFAAHAPGPPPWRPPPLPVLPRFAVGSWLAPADPVRPPAPKKALTTALERTWTGAVWKWQQRMSNLGYTIAIDGQFGPQSQGVAQAYAEKAGLTSPGELAGHVTAAAWDAAFADQASGPQVDTAAGSLGPRAVELVALMKGAPYAWGGAGPDSFDCSGLVMWVFDQLGWSLPHNAAMQYEVVSHIPVSRLARGDLVFFPDSAGDIVHVGIYAGDHEMWNAPETGETVQLEPIWTTDIRAGRVG
jgi:cell wall-associated NlpC family hydrolase